MTIEERTVTVKQFPQLMNGKQERAFLDEIKICMDAHRPRIVIDCSNIAKLDRSAIHLLFCCLEEAIKRNGDIKLAALPAETEEILEVTGALRIFDIYATTADAANSFHRLPTDAVSQTTKSASSHSKPGSAA